MSRLDREAGAAVPLDGRAGVMSGGSLAAELIKTPAIARAFIVEGLGEFSLIIERPPVAAIVNGVAEEGLWAQMLIQIGNSAGAHELEQRAGDDFRNGRHPETLIMGLPPTMAVTGH